MTHEIDLADPIARANPYAIYAQLRREAPIARVRIKSLGTIWVLSRYDDVAQAFRDHRLLNDRSAALGQTNPRDKWWLPSIMKAFETSMIMQDEPHHRRLRSLVHQAFTPRMVEQLSTRITEVAHQLLDDLQKRGSADLIESYALPLPLVIISEIMGVPEKDQPVFRTLIEGFTEPKRTLGAIVKTAGKMVRLTRFFKKLVKLRQTEPGDDLTSRLLQAKAEGHAQLSQDEVVAMLLLLLFAGHETTVNLIASGTLALLEHPDQFALLREKTELIGSAVEELLRYTSPAEHSAPRYASEDIVYHGLTIPKRTAILPLVASANRDEDVFTNAEKLDITRNPNRHVAFGAGVHFCLGAPLARLEGKIAMLALVERFPNLRLSVPKESLTWRQAPGLRALDKLPLHVT